MLINAHYNTARADHTYPDGTAVDLQASDSKQSNRTIIQTHVCAMRGTRGETVRREEAAGVALNLYKWITQHAHE